MRIYLDDVRDAPKYDFVGDPITWDEVVRTAERAIELVRTGRVTFISFDHDLGTELSGYDVAKEIENLAAEHKIPPIDYSIHSGNVIGSANIDSAMKSAWRFWEDKP